MGSWVVVRIFKVDIGGSCNFVLVILGYFEMFKEIKDFFDGFLSKVCIE